VVSAVFSYACDPPPDPGYDLPAGWTEAEHVETFMGPRKPTEAGEDGGEVLVAASSGDEVRVYYRGVFPCVEPYTAFVRPASAGGYDVLVQPVEIHPAGVNACGSDLYDLRFFVGEGQADTSINLYRRGSDKSADYPVPALVGSVVAGAEQGDCADLAACGTDAPCDGEGAHSDEITDWTLGCYQLPSCGGARCAWDGEACLLECQHTACAVLESYPAQLDCAAM
jgi:hypothetical protein